MAQTPPNASGLGVSPGQRWRRGVARAVDATWIAALVGALFALFAPGTFTTPSLAAAASGALAFWIGHVVLESAFLAIGGMTPGKALVGLCVVDNRGERLPWSVALARSGRTLTEGCALWVPPFFVVTFLVAERRLAQQLLLRWDTSLKTRVEFSGSQIRERTGWAAYLAAVFMFTFVAGAHVLTSGVDAAVSKVGSAPAWLVKATGRWTFVNKVTGRKLVMDRSWRLVSEQLLSSGTTYSVRFVNASDPSFRAILSVDRNSSATPEAVMARLATELTNDGFVIGTQSAKPVSEVKGLTAYLTVVSTKVRANQVSLSAADVWDDLSGVWTVRLDVPFIRGHNNELTVLRAVALGDGLQRTATGKGLDSVNVNGSGLPSFRPYSYWINPVTGAVAAFPAPWSVTKEETGDGGYLAVVAKPADSSMEIRFSTLLKDVPKSGAETERRLTDLAFLGSDVMPVFSIVEENGIRVLKHRVFGGIREVSIWPETATRAWVLRVVTPDKASQEAKNSLAEARRQLLGTRPTIR